MNSAILSSPPVTLPALPYDQSSLQPVISANTLGIHYGKHHKTYVDTLNKLIAGTQLADLSLEKIIKVAAGRPDHAAIFENAAQGVVDARNEVVDQPLDRSRSPSPTQTWPRAVDGRLGSIQPNPQPSQEATQRGDADANARSFSEY